MSDPYDYDIGDEVAFTGTFTELDGTPQDPSTVTFKIRDPSGNVDTLVYNTDAQPTKQSVGVYQVLYTLDEAGEWIYRYVSTGTGAGAGTKRIYVRGDVFN